MNYIAIFYEKGEKEIPVCTFNIHAKSEEEADKKAWNKWFDPKNKEYDDVVVTCDIQLNQKVIFAPKMKFYWKPHYLSCMSWSPNKKGRKCYKWLFWLYYKDDKEKN